MALQLNELEMPKASFAAAVTSQAGNGFDDNGSDVEYSYEALKAYQMLYQPKHYDGKFLHSWVMLNLQRNLPQNVTKAQLQQLGLERRIRLAVPDYVALGHVLLQTDLIATVPARFAERICATLALEQRRVPVQLPESVIHQIWHGRAHRDPAHRWMRGLLHRVFAERPTLAQPHHAG